MPRHSGCAVIQNDNRDLPLVIDGVDQRRDAGVQKSGVANNRHHPVARDAGPGHAQSLPDAGTHTGGGIHRIQRRIGAQRITANITGNNQLRLSGWFILGNRCLESLSQAAEHKEHAGMGAARAEKRRATGQFRQVYPGLSRSRRQETSLTGAGGDNIGIKLANTRDKLFTGNF